MRDRIKDQVVNRHITPSFSTWFWPTDKVSMPVKDLIEHYVYRKTTIQFFT